MPTSNFQPIRLLDPGYWYKFTYLMPSCVDETDLDLHCLSIQGISGFSRTRVNIAGWASNSLDPAWNPHSVVICSWLSVPIFEVKRITKDLFKKEYVCDRFLRVSIKRVMATYQNLLGKNIYRGLPAITLPRQFYKKSTKVQVFKASLA